MAGEVWNVCSPCSFLNEASIFVGPQSFKTPIDAGLVGNFGFHAGANVGDAVWHRFGIGYQLGGAVAASDFNGVIDITNIEFYRSQFGLATDTITNATYTIKLSYSANQVNGLAAVTFANNVGSGQVTFGTYRFTGVGTGSG